LAALHNIEAWFSYRQKGEQSIAAHNNFNMLDIQLSLARFFVLLIGNTTDIVTCDKAVANWVSEVNNHTTALILTGPRSSIVTFVDRLHNFELFTIFRLLHADSLFLDKTRSASLLSYDARKSNHIRMFTSLAFLLLRSTR
jgi:hypothetical protein